MKAFRELEKAPANEPAYSAWGMYGKEDELGTLNLLTGQHVVDAARLIRKGSVFSLNLPLELPNPPLFGRSALQHKIVVRRENVFDDVYNDFNTQSSTQWDGLRHFGTPFGFYNGLTHQEIESGEGSRLGIQNPARRGIAGRAVLIDFERWARLHKKDYSPVASYGITADEIKQIAAEQGITFRSGDILLFRTGFISWYLNSSPEERNHIAQNVTLAGLAQGEKTLEFLWDNHISLAATDSPGFEVWPPKGELLHTVLLPSWGMMLGELFDLDKLAADCASDGCYEMFFTSAPLNKLAGIASPPNALAIK